MHSKAVTKWTIELFIVILVIIVAIIILLVKVPELFVKILCPKAQIEEINKIQNKVNEVKGRPGYEVVYFEVKKECVENIKYANQELIVKYTKASDPIKYKTDFDWDIGDGIGPGDYPLRVYADRVELMGGG
jgi:LPS O-antigen subunit length determinant protein (WzzB/FepE family)